MEQIGKSKGQASAGRAQPSSDSKAEIDALRKQLALERKEKEALQRNVGTKTTADDDDDVEMDEDDATCNRDARIQTLTTHLKAIAAVYGGESAPEYLAKKGELDRLLKERREGKPLKHQLQHVEGKITKHKKKLEKAQGRSAELEKQIAELTAEQEKADDELCSSLAELAALEKERKDLLLREAKANTETTGDGKSTMGNSPKIDDKTAWDHVVQAITVQAQKPGVNPAIAGQVSSVLQLLHTLCIQLAASAGSGGAAMGGGGVVPQMAPQVGGGAGVVSEADGGGGGGGVPTAIDAAAMAQQQLQQQQEQHRLAAAAAEAAAIQQQAMAAAAGPAQQQQGSQHEPAAAEAAEAAAAREHKTQQGDDAVTEAASGAPAGTGSSSSASGGVTSNGGDATGATKPLEVGEPAGEEVDSDLEGDPSAAGERLDMDIDELLAPVSADQRGRVRGLLARRREKASGHGKLKKLVEEVVTNPKKPCTEK